MLATVDKEGYRHPLSFVAYSHGYGVFHGIRGLDTSGAKCGVEEIQRNHAS